MEGKGKRREEKLTLEVVWRRSAIEDMSVRMKERYMAGMTVTRGRELTLNDAWNLSSTLDSSESGSTPDSASNELERSGRDLGSSGSDTCSEHIARRSDERWMARAMKEWKKKKEDEPITVETPQPLWQASRADRITSTYISASSTTQKHMSGQSKEGRWLERKERGGRTFPVASKVKSRPPSVISMRCSVIVLPSGSSLGLTNSVAPN
jgi:hypothetical protein